MAKVILDAGHGGADPGAVYEGRQEKDDNLRLALAVGDILEDNGVEVAYTRTEDVYDTPLQKAQAANREGGDFFVSIHRNSSPEANQYSGVETLVYDRSGEKLELAEAINEELSEVGFRNLGVKERPGLIVLRRTEMPAVLVEAGFLNTEADNLLFDEKFDQAAQAIAEGILRTLDGQETTGQGGRSFPASDSSAAMQTLCPHDSGVAQTEAETPANPEVSEENPESGEDTGCPRLFRVQTGAFRSCSNAQDQLYQLLRGGFPSYILQEDGYYKVQTGAYRRLDHAVQMEEALRKKGYSTFITA